jgi:hypothetical protein
VSNSKHQQQESGISTFSDAGVDLHISDQLWVLPQSCYAFITAAVRYPLSLILPLAYEPAAQLGPFVLSYVMDVLPRS